MKKRAFTPRVAELYTLPTSQAADWKAVAKGERCTYLNGKCTKNRKLQEPVTIGTCSMLAGESRSPLTTCPVRFLERKQIFLDCIHLLTLHEPGNELRLVSDLKVPGGSVDWCLVSTWQGKPRDFVGIEVQTLDTTGIVWRERQRFLKSVGVKVNPQDTQSNDGFGVNWKMTAKTILMQLHHKLPTFEHVNKRLVLVLQDCFLDKLRSDFRFGRIQGHRDGDSMHLFAYSLEREDDAFRLSFKERISTDSQGITASLGSEAEPKIELQSLLSRIEAKLSKSVKLDIASADVPLPKSIDRKADDL